MTFADFLLWEETHITKLMSFRASNGIHYWPIVRVFFAMRYLEVNNNLSNPHAAIDNSSFVTKLKWVFRTLFKAFIFAPKAPLFVFGSTVVNMKEGSSYTNRLYDTMKTILGSKMILCEASYRYVFRLPRKVTTYSSDLLTVLAYLNGKLVKISKNDKQEIEKFVSFLDEKFICKFDREIYSVVERITQSMVKRYPFYLRIAKYLKKWKTIKACMVEDASYGVDKAIFILALFKVGITTIEHQHGLIAKNHPAYNYAKTIVDKSNNYYQYLPKFYMTFGEYWSSCARTPSGKIVFGFPYLIKKTTKKTVDEILDSILVVSDATMPQLNIDICTIIQRHVKNNEKIVLKLHPGEVPYLNERYGVLIGCENIYIKTYEPIYDMLSNAKMVVGFTSTVMVEALAYGIKPFVYKTDYSQEIFDGIDFNYFSTLTEFEGMFNETKRKADTNTKCYWELESEKRYTEFFISQGVL